MTIFCQQNDFEGKQSSGQALNAFDGVQRIAIHEGRQRRDGDVRETRPDEADRCQDDKSQHVPFPFQLVKLHAEGQHAAIQKKYKCGISFNCCQNKIHTHKTFWVKSY